jgi:hypothetical protein
MFCPKTFSSSAGKITSILIVGSKVRPVYHSPERVFPVFWRFGLNMALGTNLFIWGRGRLFTSTSDLPEVPVMFRCLKMHTLVPLWVLSPFVLAGLCAQQLDTSTSATQAISQDAERTLKLSFEQRGRYEARTGNAFGNDVDVATGLYRTRLGLTYTPIKWLKLSGMVQDSRAPWYGPNAPSSTRDPADLHEGYIELFPSYKKGLGVTAGRMMLNYGEGRLIGTPQWGNLSRTYDQGRIYWRSPRAQLEVLLVSQVMYALENSTTQTSVTGFGAPTTNSPTSTRRTCSRLTFCAIIRTGREDSPEAPAQMARTISVSTPLVFA